MCKSCRTCFKFYCMFYFTCDRCLNIRSGWIAESDKHSSKAENHSSGSEGHSVDIRDCEMGRLIMQYLESDDQTRPYHRGRAGMWIHEYKWFGLLFPSREIRSVIFWSCKFSSSDEVVMWLVFSCTSISERVANLRSVRACVVCFVWCVAKAGLNRRVIPVVIGTET